MSKAPHAPQNGAAKARKVAAEPASVRAQAPPAPAPVTRLEAANDDSAVLTWRAEGPDPDVVALGVSEVPRNGNEVPMMGEATVGQLARMLLCHCDGADFYADPVLGGFEGVKEDLQVAVDVLTFGERYEKTALVNSLSRTLQRLRVAIELHERQRAWFVAQLEGRPAAMPKAPRVRLGTE